MLTSVLIHEYGHHLWFDASGKQPDSLDDEVKANEYGLNAMPAHLIPEFYQEYRKFFLKSYRDELDGRIWDEAICLKEYNQWSHTTRVTAVAPAASALTFQESS